MPISEVRLVLLDELEIGKAQARTRDVGKGIEDLAESIKALGLLEPIVVAPTDSGKFEILTGQRRFLAHRHLGETEILAAILDGAVDESEAKAISLTENLMRRDLNRLDTIDACTWLYKKYGTIKAVVDSTGLSYTDVSAYVKYDRLIPELKALVDSNEVDLKKALRAQDVTITHGGSEVPDPAEAVKLAKELSSMNGVMAKKLAKGAAERPDISTDELIEDAKTGGKVTQILVTISAAVHAQLKRYAADEGTTQDDAAATLLEDALSGKGYAD